MENQDNRQVIGFLIHFRLNNFILFLKEANAVHSEKKGLQGAVS